MINTQLKFEGKIHNGSKSCCIHKESHKIVKFQGQFYLEGQGQGHQFSNPSDTVRCLIKGSS